MSYRWLGIPLLLGILLFTAVYLLVQWLEPATELPAPSQLAKPEPAYSLEEKVGRLFIVGHWATTPVASTTALIKQYHLGGVIIMNAPKNPDEVLAWTSEWQSATDYPLMIAIDQEGGTVQRLRGADFIATAQPSISTPEQAFAVGKERGQELAALGINLNFAPVVERSVSPQGFLYRRTFRDPDQIPTLASSMLAGFNEASVSGVIKHYPGHEDEPTDSHVDLPIVELTGTDFAAHTKHFNTLLADDGIKLLMTAHVLVPSLDPAYPATLSKKILTGELRGKQNYDGIIITDDMTMDAIDARFTTEEAAALALEAGADLILFAAEPAKAPSAIAHTLSEVEETVVDEHFARLENWQTN